MKQFNIKRTRSVIMVDYSSNQASWMTYDELYEDLMVEQEIIFNLAMSWFFNTNIASEKVLSNNY